MKRRRWELQSEPADRKRCREDGGILSSALLLGSGLATFPIQLRPTRLGIVLPTEVWAFLHHYQSRKMPPNMPTGPSDRAISTEVSSFQIVQVEIQDLLSHVCYRGGYILCVGYILDTGIIMGVYL